MSAAWSAGAQDVIETDDILAAAVCIAMELSEVGKGVLDDKVAGPPDVG